MSKIQIKISNAEAKKKIESQIRKAEDLFCKGEKELSSSSVEGTRARDNFKILYEQWEDFTCEILREIFVSSSYARKFVEVRSSEVEYVAPNWVPGIKYFLEKQIIPKKDYLGILIHNIDQFTKVIEEKNLSPLITLPDNNLDLPEKVTLAGLWKYVPVKFWLWFLGLSITILIVGITLGQISWVKEIFEK